MGAWVIVDDVAAEAIVGGVGVGAVSDEVATVACLVGCCFVSTIVADDVCC